MNVLSSHTLTLSYEITPYPSPSPYLPKVIELPFLFYGFLGHIGCHHPDSIINRDWGVEPVVDEVFLQLGGGGGGGGIVRESKETSCVS